MDRACMNRLHQLRERREVEAAERAEALADNPPVDAEGNPIPLGEPLVAVPLSDLRELVKAAVSNADDDNSAKKKLKDLQKGARGASGVPAIQLCDLKFLLERVPLTP